MAVLIRFGIPKNPFFKLFKPATKFDGIDLTEVTVHSFSASADLEIVDGNSLNVFKRLSLKFLSILFISANNPPFTEKAEANPNLSPL